MAERFDSESRRAQILARATEVFAANGYDAARTAAIAERAGVSERLLYKHFTGKQELFLAVINVVAEAVAEQYRELAAREVGLLEGLMQEFESRFGGPGAIAANRPLLLGRTYGPFEDSDLNDALARAHRIMSDSVTRYFRWAQDRGLLRPGVDPEAAAWTWGSILRGHDALRNAYGLKHARMVGQQVVRQFVDGIAADPADNGKTPGHQRSARPTSRTR